MLLLALDFRQLIHLNSTFAGFDSRLRPFTRVMGDTYDELDMMLEEPYKAKTGRYDRVSVTLPSDLSYHLIPSTYRSDFTKKKKSYDIISLANDLGL